MDGGWGKNGKREMIITPKSSFPWREIGGKETKGKSSLPVSFYSCLNRGT